MQRRLLASLFLILVLAGCVLAQEVKNPDTLIYMSYGTLNSMDPAFVYDTDSGGVIKLLEVNPNPGWCWDGKFNYMAGFAGLRYSQMLELVLKAAQERVCGGEDGILTRKYPEP